MLIGEFKGTLDDKGRVSLPAALRKELNEDILYLTKGEDDCLWLYPSEKFDKLVNDNLRAVTDPFSKTDRRTLRQHVGSAQQVEIDKAGRIPIVQNLREFASLSKECMILGQLDYIEIWDIDCYNDYFNKDKKGEFESAAEVISQRIKQKRGIV